MRRLAETIEQDLHRSNGVWWQPDRATGIALPNDRLQTSRGSSRPFLQDCRTLSNDTWNDRAGM